MNSSPLKAWQIAEAALFSSPQPLDEETLARYLPPQTDIAETMSELEKRLEGHGIRPAKLNDKWYLRTTEAVSPALALRQDKKIQLSTSALETLAAIAYLQPVTRSGIEGVRGRKVSPAVLETLMRLNWIAPKGRKRSPGRAITWGTTEQFLKHFSLPNIEALPKPDDLAERDLRELKKGGQSIFFKPETASENSPENEGSENEAATEDESEEAPFPGEQDD